MTAGPTEPPEPGTGAAGTGIGTIRSLMRSLRVRLAVTGFLTAYAPTLVLLLVGLAFFRTSDVNVLEDVINGEPVESEIIENGPSIPLWLLVTVTIGFSPFAAVFAWWWSGRAVKPIAEAVALQERLMEETSHELRTPLAVLTNNAQVLLAHPEPTLEVYRQGLERSEAMAERMSETIDSLLVDARGRARTIDRRPTDIVGLTRSAVGSLSGLAEQAELTLVLTGPDVVEAAVDGVSVTRAITNLIRNAVQHSPAGSTVLIEVLAAGDNGVVTVTDNGPGIEPDATEQIFQRYWRRGDNEGSGIGLAIVHQVAMAHGGEITVDSPVADGRGSRFTLSLPLHRG